MSRRFSGKIFNTVPDSSKPVVASAMADLRQWADGSVRQRAVGANLEHDWRLPQRRQTRIWNFQSATRPATDFRDRLLSYFEETIHDKDVPDFLLPHNEDNWLVEVSRKTLLCNTWKLPQNIDLLTAALDPAGNQSALLPTEGAGSELGASWVRRRISELFPNQDRVLRFLTAEQKIFLDRLFALGGDRPRRHAVWACLWAEFRRYLDEGADSWLGAVGVRKPQQPWPVFVFQYPVGDLTLVRPSVVDSKLYDEHFPSPPPECDWTVAARSRPVGGHPMDVRIGTTNDDLLQEFIHADFRRSSEMVVAWEWSADIEQSPLETARKGHYLGLFRSYTGVDAWMNEPT